MRKKLKTHDKLKPWDVGGAVNLNLVCCSLCKTGPDSHAHLFFECPYSAKVWTLIKDVTYMESSSCKWDDIVVDFLCSRKNNSAKSVIAHLVIAASVYYVWQERNNRMFSNYARPPEKIRDIILETVHYRLVKMQFKNNARTSNLLAAWKLPKALIMDDACN
uniref:uncharacterized protein LOC122591577 n=1 Tax=Erigeron canadensis TaxID=72917 RepID=UPI001CB9D550|nr:uncharacterized protein LOC122591577 [Erigeron canadensis]